jgi:hypothetical protein
MLDTMVLMASTCRDLMQRDAKIWTRRVHGYFEPGDDDEETVAAIKEVALERSRAREAFGTMRAVESADRFNKRRARKRNLLMVAGKKRSM